MEAADEQYLAIARSEKQIQRGIDRLPKAGQKTELFTWMNEKFMPRFGERNLPLDAGTMSHWGSLTARLEKMGQPIRLMESLLAVTALQNNLVMVTRNLGVFKSYGVQVINP